MAANPTPPEVDTRTIVTDIEAQREEWRQGGFDFTRDGLIVHGRPSFDDYVVSLRRNTYRSSLTNWHLGDLVLYGETRGDWNDLRDQLIELRMISARRLQKCTRVCTGYPRDTDMRRFIRKLSFTHHDIALIIEDPAKRLEVLQTAFEQVWSADVLRDHLDPTPTGDGGDGESSSDPKVVVCPQCGHRFVPEQDD